MSESMLVAVFEANPYLMAQSLNYLPPLRMHICGGGGRYGHCDKVVNTSDNLLSDNRYRDISAIPELESIEFIYTMFPLFLALLFCILDTLFTS